jgi:tetratricopeptide (TPR) repeat protein
MEDDIAEEDFLIHEGLGRRCFFMSGRRRFGGLFFEDTGADEVKFWPYLFEMFVHGEAGGPAVRENLWADANDMRADPENSFLHRVMGEALEMHGFTREAEMRSATELKLCRAAADTESLTAVVGTRIGILELKLGHLRPAIEILQSVIDQEPSYWQAREHLGDAYAAVQDYGRAIEHYREAIERSWGRLASFLFKLARALQASGDLDEALETATRCQRLAGDYLPTYGLLAELSQ